MSAFALIANGRIEDYQKIAPSIASHEQIIAVDGGYHHCKKMGITPDLLIGDFDSFQEISSVQIPRKKFPKDKNFSDLELAIEESLSLGADKITLFGALEKRLDHAISNLSLLLKYPSNIVIESSYEKTFALSGTNEVTTQPFQTISLLPLFSPAYGVTTKGLKWELTKQTLDQNFLSLSNVSLGSSFTVTVEKGTLICTLNEKNK